MDDPAQQLAANTLKQLATDAIRQTLLDNRGVAFCRSCLVKLVRHNNVSAQQHVQNAVQAFFREPGPFLKKNECSQCRIVGINRALTAPPESG
jgi:hypothetical protein